ncbi:hypothetical protein QTH91_01050 [Variovorax dokdonensis]|uniref:Phage tail protein n=1 Tax=Variovorax dokdonensis TaxID=344883 RepID=A0ABT7N563_9BURK|nr:hypothetical protein [Variovorax dokdonensis]MDM0043057.1 hypothetical protein [Variovorax dokdonensis]
MAEPVPPSGSMYLYDYAAPPLLPGDYRYEVSTSIEKSGTSTETLSHERYFSVVGPRFVLNPGDIAGVVPPRNSQGPFSAVLPQIVMRRRTLPWERVIANALPAPSAPTALPNQKPDYPTPWMALLLLAEGEDWELQPNLPLESVLPSAVFKTIGSPANVLVEALDIDRALLDAVLPAREELQLLSHVRRVNANDRELSVEGSDGWFAVVVCNRLPAPGKKCRAVLVSLEGRTDLVATNPPAFVGSHGGGLVGLLDHTVFELADDDTVLQMKEASLPAFLDAPQAFRSASAFEGARVREEANVLAKARVLPRLKKPRAKLVAMTSWSFTCEGDGDFMQLMQHLDVGLIGKTKDGKPPVTDTGHIRVELGTRAGTKETALFRGPLVPMPLQRDPDGPYHSADQARRIAPELGLQDISYACAFEVGRLLAAADARLAQELMRWRRKGFGAAARLDVMADLEARLDLVLAEAIPQKLQQYVLPVVAGELIKTFATVGPPAGDAFGLGLMSATRGMQPELVAKAFGLDGIEAAREAMLGISQPLATRVPTQAEPVLKGGTLAEVLKDVQGLSMLQETRGQVIDNVRLRVDTIGKAGSTVFGPVGARKGKGKGKGGGR